MSVLPTESNINMTGAGLVGKSTSGAGKSGRMDSASVLSWLGLSASGVTDGKALIASSNTIAWSPAAAALLPDTLPAAGTLLSYGGSRQLAAGGNVSHAGDITLTGGANGIYLSPSGVNKGLIYFASGQNRLYGQPAVPWVIESDAGFKVRNSANSADAAITAGAATFSGAITVGSYTDLTCPNGIALITDGNRRIGLGYSGRGIQASSGLSIGFAPGTTIDGSASDAYFVRNSASSIGVKGALGIDGALTCGTITASGAIVGVGTIGDSASVGGMNGFDFTTAGTVLIRQGGTRWVGWKSIGTVFSNAGGIGFAANGAASAFTSAVYEVSNGWRLQADSGLSIRNLANSADAALTCGAITASGAVMETPTQSTINPTTVNIPTGQRRGWYNSTLAEFRDWVNIGGTLLKSAAYT